MPRRIKGMGWAWYPLVSMARFRSSGEAPPSLVLRHGCSPCPLSPTLNQRVPGSSPGAPTKQVAVIVAAFLVWTFAFHDPAKLRGTDLAPSFECRPASTQFLTACTIVL